MAAPTVTAFLSTLAHRRKADIERLRALILAADPTLGEQIKWNAPSFGRNGADRITFRLQPGDKVDLIFHRGAKVKDNAGFAFDDPAGLLKWLAPDRAIVVFADREAIEASADALGDLVRRWIAAA
jgi:hypothetical protein